MHANQNESHLIKEMLVGRSIISADARTGRLTLDNGTVLLLSGNDGCGGCISGFFNITWLADFDNKIMNVSVVRKESDDEDRITYEIFVFGSAAERTDEEGTAIATISGVLGNGYYGEGFTLQIEGWFDEAENTWKKS